MAATAQQLNAVSRECAGLRQLVDVIFSLKENRVALDTLAVTSLADGDFAGDLDHVTAHKIRACVAALDALDAVLTTPAPLDGATEPPIYAIVQMIR